MSAHLTWLFNAPTMIYYVITILALSLPNTYAVSLHAMLPDTQLTARGAISVSMSISDASDLISVTMTGPANVYFSVALGSCKMDGAWALVIPGAGADPFEQRLGADRSGDRLLSTFAVQSDVTS